MLELETLTTCPVCGGEYIPAIIFLKDERVSHDQLRYCNCMKCGQLFLNPRMTDEQTAAYYAGEYRNTVWGESGEDEQDTHVQKLRASLHAQVADAWGVVPFTVLEIGSGAGFMLWEWFKRGAMVRGIEPDERCHKREPGKRFKMYKDIAELPAQPFELIVMSHVLEHFNHPKEYLQDLIARYAGPATRLLIEVPNTESCLAAYQLHHPMAYTGYTLAKLLATVGYQVEHLLYHGLTSTQTQPYLLALFKPGNPSEHQATISIHAKSEMQTNLQGATV